MTLSDLHRDHRKAPFIIVFILCLLFSGAAWAETPPGGEPETSTPQKIELTLGKSLILRSGAPVKRISVAVPEIADAVVLSPQQIYLTGKTTGVTNLIIWEGDRGPAVYDIEVSPDTTRLKEKLHEILPDEKEVMVTSTHENIAISGTVSSAANMTQVLALAEAYAPGKIINLLEVGGVHQVMLEVRVAEMSRSLTRRLGFNFNYLQNDGKIGFSMLNNLTGLEDSIVGNSTVISDSINALFQFSTGDMLWTVLLDALKQNGLAKVLAEPTLITLSGQSANFLAGGEFPIPVPQELGRTTIQYKEFGVGLNFTPTVLSNKKISMKIAPEVSELDFTNAVTFSGFVIPAVTTRRVATVIELGDGQSFAIAGLLRDNVTEVVSKFPLLGDIPVLGALFRSSSFQKNETELVVIVTPRLVKPLDPAKQTLPTDKYVEPSDSEFYLVGATEGKAGKESGNPSAAEGGASGDFGHIVTVNE